MTGMQILVVDDEVPVGELLGVILKSAGHAVTTVSDGQSALTAMENANYSLVISDLTMPGIDGISLARKIKSAHPSQQIILLTGATNSVPASNDVDYVLNKPIDPDKLTGFIAELAQVN